MIKINIYIININEKNILRNKIIIIIYKFCLYLL